MCGCIGLTLPLQQHNAIVECHNAIVLSDEVVELAEIAFQAAALFTECLEQALVVEIGHDPIHWKGLGVLVLITSVVRKADQNFPIGQVGDQARGGCNGAAIRNGLDQIKGSLAMAELGNGLSVDPGLDAVWNHPGQALIGVGRHSEETGQGNGPSPDPSQAARFE